MPIENSLVSLEGVLFLLLTLHTFFNYIIIQRKEGEDELLQKSSSRRLSPKKRK
jgi:hypothetical protein